MPLTYDDARRIVGSSTDWAIGLEISLEKWEQITGGDIVTYDRDTRCGLCFIACNRSEDCSLCPADNICNNVMLCDDVTSKEVLEMLQAIDLEEG